MAREIVPWNPKLGPPPIPTCQFCGRACYCFHPCEARKRWLARREWTTIRGLKRKLGRKLERWGRRLQGMTR